MLFSAFPQAQGLYDPDQESDSCGVAMIANIFGHRSHSIISDGLLALENLEHRGAAGAEPNSGDGAGILIQLPVELLRELANCDLPESDALGNNTFAAGLCFLPQDLTARAAAMKRVEEIAADEDLQILGWQEVSVDPVGAGIGVTALGCMPFMSYVFVSAAPVCGELPSGIGLDRLIYGLRKRAEQITVDIEAEGSGVYFPSLSSRTMVFKGMLTTAQLGMYFTDLRNPLCTSAIAIVHSRFSTNTFPSWPLAHPFRYIAHNGEINTVRGNRNRMRARETLLNSSLIPGDLTRLFPICTKDASDSASLDEVLELLHLGGRSIAHVVMMMVPEAWENHASMNAERRAFYQFHASVMEAWDGPACITFTDGSSVGAVLDRNGLRPGRWLQTSDGRVVLASETGVLDIRPEDVVAKGRLEPGKMFLIDTVQGKVVDDEDIKGQLASEQPYSEWLHAGLLELKSLPERPHVHYSHESVVRRQIAFGYTEEELRILL
ncbi:MAG: glutamate synthase subunit alpha, partial [Mycobacteriaceae bacterium]